MGAIWRTSAQRPGNVTPWGDAGSDVRVWRYAPIQNPLPARV